jgi:phosphoenolpyruvate phosphomutase
MPAEDAHGEWVGLMKLNARGANLVRAEIEAMEKDGTAAKAGLPDLVNRLIAKGEKPAVVYVTGDWLDVNDAFDLARARNFT